MVLSEKEIFEQVLNETGFIVKTNDNGLYTLQHKTSGMEDIVQTNGYNLLESLRRLTTSKIAKDVLR